MQLAHFTITCAFDLDRDLDLVMPSLAFQSHHVFSYDVTISSRALANDLLLPSTRDEILHTGGDEKPDINFAWP